MLTVLRCGPQALVQDRGRPGYAHLGVPPSGALDLPALEHANRLVGNPESAAGIEALLGGIALRAGSPCMVAVTGAVADLSTGAWGAAVRLAVGDVLRVGTPTRGLRCYLAVSGGLAVPAALGSRSTDVLSGLGPAPLSAGDVLPLGSQGTMSARPPAGEAPTQQDPPAPVLELPVLLGPRDDWFHEPAVQLATGQWTVSPAGNRIGVRLHGTCLHRAQHLRDVELPTEPVVTGAVQVPPSGQPVIFLNDHPTTGGYPVVGVVPPQALPALAQARPGVTVRLAPATAVR